jgi:hypothetical protein
VKGGRRRAGRAGTLAVAGALAFTGTLGLAACGSGSTAAPASGAAGTPAAVSMATSIAAGGDTWAVVPMSADPAFWEVFARAGNSGSWKLVTPPGVADNGGLVAAAGAAKSLTVAVRPSQDLVFSPLAQTADGGVSWSSGGPIDAAVAASPDAFAADGGHLAALLSDGTVETSSDAGASWSALAKPGAIAASPAGQGCGGAVRVTSISFGITGTDLLAGGTCGTGGSAAVFAYSPGGGWQRLSLPVPGPVVRLTDGMALVRGKSGLAALWPVAEGWGKSAVLPVSGPVSASGTLTDAGAWVLLAGGRAATVSAPGTTSGQPRWRPLTPVPAHTAVLASGPDGAVDALAVSGETLTVWRLAANTTAWSRVQRISVPVQLGSSG